MNTKSAKKNYDNLFKHLLRYQKLYLCLLLMVFSVLSTFSSYVQGKPLLVGGESYYHLSSAQGPSLNPLTFLFKLVPDQSAFILPPLMSLGTIVLFYVLAQKIKISDKKIFFTVLFYIFTPAFMFASLTLSSYSAFLLLVLLGVNLMLLEDKNKYLSLIPFLIASCIDTFSALLLLAGILSYFFIVKKSKERFPLILAAAVAVVTIINIVALRTFFFGPFTVQNRAADLISDLGSFSGVGLFTLALAIIGLIASGNKKNIPIMLPALAILITAYLFNTHTVFFLSLAIIILAAAGFVHLMEQDWRLPFLKNTVLLLLILGVSFSAVAYHDRLSEHPPTAIDQKALEWIQRNTDEEAVVLSVPENSYYISYFAQRKPVFSLHHGYKKDYELSKDIFSAFYIDELFPLLEENKVSIIYVSEEMKREFPAQQEFLFLLQNERFKLLYFSGEAEVWSFESSHSIREAK